MKEQIFKSRRAAERFQAELRRAGAQPSVHECRGAFRGRWAVRWAA